MATATSVSSVSNLPVCRTAYVAGTPLSPVQGAWKLRNLSAVCSTREDELCGERERKLKTKASFASCVAREVSASFQNKRS